MATNSKNTVPAGLTNGWGSETCSSQSGNGHFNQSCRDIAAHAIARGWLKLPKSERLPYGTHPRKEYQRKWRAKKKLKEQGKVVPMGEAELQKRRAAKKPWQRLAEKFAVPVNHNQERTVNDGKS